MTFLWHAFTYPKSQDSQPFHFSNRNPSESKLAISHKTITSPSSLSLIYLSLSHLFCQARPSLTPSLCNISISNSSNFKPKYLPPPFSCCFPYLSKFYFTCRFESFIHQILFTTDLRFSKWGRKIVYSQQQSNCCTHERGRMGKKSRETKSFSLYFQNRFNHTGFRFYGWTGRFLIISNF